MGRGMEWTGVGKRGRRLPEPTGWGAGAGHSVIIHRFSTRAAVCWPLTAENMFWRGERLGGDSPVIL